MGHSRLTRVDDILLRGAVSVDTILRPLSGEDLLDLIIIIIIIIISSEKLPDHQFIPLTMNGSGDMGNSSLLTVLSRPTIYGVGLPLSNTAFTL